MDDANMDDASLRDVGLQEPTFGQRLRAAMDGYGPLCAGIDPHRALVESWGLRYDVDGLAAFTDTCVEAFAGHVGVVKPQSAFFEVFGSAGVAVLEGAVRALREAGTLVILDAKRGDIGSTMAAYAEASLGKDAVAPADAVTLSPYLGFESLRPALDLAAQTGRGVFVLGLTSNPEGRTVQHARLRDVSVAESMVAGAAAENAGARERGQLGSVGLVVGATVGSAVQELGLDLAGAAAPLLAPGVGAQGGTSEDLRRVFGDALPNVLPSSSREVLSAGPDVGGLRDRAVRTSESLAALLR
ncbi:orotidine-5'-phosphate decarboxylase [Phycicoccus badiiscoriae]|uniref:Orotidine 5'-phosphate decarboxylase n=1 Tax=Pedococcus badiiscoriae TaxID=642776 RepID=A0A852WSN1_9MICO|nr:orotidine-5'-phosphate decarboxylase [Pedococcus badiiscoriae]NYG08296.1 orotidine-5'-phosphate decarboxylase [Pedococcus badiiscoriae]